LTIDESTTGFKSLHQKLPLLLVVIFVVNTLDRQLSDQFLNCTTGGAVVHD
jgi:hypothetical protein